MVRVAGVVACVIAAVTGLATMPASAGDGVRARVAAVTRAANRSKDHHAKQASAVLHADNASRVGGDARLLWETRRHTLLIRMRVKHLPARSGHAARVEVGTCQGGDHTVVYELRDVNANQFGGGRSRTRIRDVETVDFTQPWHVAVYRGIAAGESADVISCGDVRPER